VLLLRRLCLHHTTSSWHYPWSCTPSLGRGDSSSGKLSQRSICSLFHTVHSRTLCPTTCHCVTHCHPLLQTHSHPPQNLAYIRRFKLAIVGEDVLELLRTELSSARSDRFIQPAAGHVGVDSEHPVRVDQRARLKDMTQQTRQVRPGRTPS
jgi:hypothetical protein